MNRERVLSILKQLEPTLRGYGIDALYLYGSYARDEAQPDSDIDILVDFANGSDDDFSTYMASYRILEESFPDIAIGYGTRDNIVPRYRPHIEQSAVRVF